MATIVCNKSCKYRKAVYCGKDIIILNQFGCCDVWFDRNGQVRAAPNYPLEPEPKEDSKQELPPDEKNGGIPEDKQKTQNDEKASDE